MNKTHRNIEHIGRENWYDSMCSMFLCVSKNYTLRCCLLIIFAGGIAEAQNLEKVGKKGLLKISGGLNYNGIYYQAFNKASTRDPFTWYLNGNLTFSILDWSIPFSYSYSNRQGNYTQPFNQYGLTPSYKWFKGYAGWNSLSFSPYTLSGHVFMGGGAELTPKKWKIAALYGRLKKASEYDFENSSDANMAYKRMGYGVKIGYEKNGQMLSLNFFKAKDVLNSLTFLPSTTSIIPEENTVVSLQGKATIKKVFSLETEFALSGMTNNLFAEKSEGKNYLPYIFTLRSSSEFHTAFKSSASFNKEKYSLALNYERIAPDYKTHGSYFFNNDLENITLAPSLRMLKGKMNFALNAGLQRNNLDGKKLSTNKRLVASLNFSYAPSAKWTWSASYSNFSTFTRVRPLTDPFYVATPADTLNFYQLTQSANGVMNHSFGKKEAKQTLSLCGNYNVATQQSELSTYDPAKVYSVVAAYNINLSRSKTGIGITANGNESRSGVNTVRFFGPGLNLSKGLLKNKVRVTAGSTYNLSYTNGLQGSNVLNSRANISFSPQPKNKKFGRPSFNFSMNYMEKLAANSVPSSGEFTGTVNFSYGF
jgi:hypothetical protein